MARRVQTSPTDVRGFRDIRVVATLENIGKFVYWLSGGREGPEPRENPRGYGSGSKSPESK